MKLAKKVTVTPSKYAMWRSAIALAYADSRLSNSEVNLIQDYMSNYTFTDAQLLQLEKDLMQGVHLEDVFPMISEIRDRAHLINFARVLFHIDGDFSEVEQRIWQAIHDQHVLTIDLKKALLVAREACESELEQQRIKHAQEAAQKRPLERALDYLLDVDNDTVA
ncbi:MAG: hypothetical protein SFT92_05440 [Rickettsiales bacterium]|nr:hypothetical protein [Rickettsiales bacterium]